MTDAWGLTGRDEELQMIGAALSSGQSAGVVLAGPAGVGKTRLAREALSTMSGTATVRWTTGTASSHPIPLGAFTSWIPDHGADSMQLVRGAIDALAEGKPSVVLGIDDAHLLDDTSAFVVHQIVVRRLARVVVTVRSGEPAPKAITALWKDGHVKRVELQPLSRAETETLIESVLGGPLDPVSAHRIWRSTQGNVLYLRHLVDLERASGRMSRRGEGWTWAGELPRSSGLVDLISAEIGSLPEEIGDLVDILAVAEPLLFSTIEQFTPMDVVEQAEARGLVTVDTETLSARLAHPMYGEVRRRRAGSIRLRRIRGRVCDALAAEGTDDPNDLVRRAVLLLESDLEPDLLIVFTAAMEAIRLSDFELADRLALAADPLGYPARTLRCATLANLGRGAEADEILKTLQNDAVTDHDVAHAAMLRAANLVTIGRHVDAEAVLSEVESRCEQAGLDRYTKAGRAFLHAYEGRATVAIDAAESALKSGDLPDPVLLFVSVALLRGLADRGHAENVHSVAAHGYALAASLWAAPVIRSLLTSSHLAALWFAGHIAEAESVARRLRTELADAPGPPQVWVRGISGVGALTSGDLKTARHLLQQSLAGISVDDVRSRNTIAYRHQLAQAIAMTGDTVAAANLWQDADARRDPAFAFLEPVVLIAEAWVLAAGSELTRAIETTRRGADLAAARHQFAQEVLCLQTATQFGDRTTGPRLAELTAIVDGPRVSAAASYADALAKNDGDGLHDASVLFETMGDRIAAADAAAHASIAYARANRRGASLSNIERARALATECGGAVTPALRDAAAPVPLTGRQREILTLAMRGLTNKQIAESLHLSVRTVEGHLYRAAGKVGVRIQADRGASKTIGFE